MTAPKASGENRQAVENTDDLSTTTTMRTSPPSQNDIAARWTTVAVNATPIHRPDTECPPAATTANRHERRHRCCYLYGSAVEQVPPRAPVR